MKSVLVSTRPKWCEKICNKIGEENGKPIYEKRIEVRKTAPKEVPFKAYIYETKGATEMPWVDEEGHYIYKGKGQVIGEFICDKVVRTCGWRLRGDTQQCAKRTVAETEFPKLACLTIDEIVDYAGNENREVVGWHISDLKIYDKPKELCEFYIRCRISDKKCRLCNNCFEREDSYGRYYAVKKLTRPPQSWCYVEEL